MHSPYVTQTVEVNQTPLEAMLPAGCEGVAIKEVKAVNLRTDGNFLFMRNDLATGG